MACTESLLTLQPIAQAKGAPYTEGPLLKRSSWLRTWNLRQVSLCHKDGQPVLQWRGPRRTGSVAIGRDCRSFVDQRGELVVMCGMRRLRFRNADGGMPVEKWHAHVFLANVQRFYLPGSPPGSPMRRRNAHRR